MEQETLQANFPAEKLDALRFYMVERGLSVEGELQSYLGQIYEKHVPAATRRYLDRHDGPNKAAPQEEKSDELRQESGSAKRPSRRQAEKQQKAASQPIESLEPAEPEQAEPEYSGPVMSM